MFQNMTEERRKQIEEYAAKTGFSFAAAKRALEEIESDYDSCDDMRSIWY